MLIKKKAIDLHGNFFYSNISVSYLYIHHILENQTNFSKGSVSCTTWSCTKENSHVLMQIGISLKVNKFKSLWTFNNSVSLK